MLHIRVCFLCVCAIYLKHVPLRADDQGVCIFTRLVGVWCHCYKIRYCRQNESHAKLDRNTQTQTLSCIPRHVFLLYMRFSMTSLSLLSFKWPKAQFYLLNTHTSFWVVSRDAGLRQVLDYLLLQHFRVINMQLGSFVHQILRDVDTRRLSETHIHTGWTYNTRFSFTDQLWFHEKRLFLNKYKQTSREQ